MNKTSLRNDNIHKNYNETSVDYSCEITENQANEIIENVRVVAIYYSENSIFSDFFFTLLNILFVHLFRTNCEYLKARKVHWRVREGMMDLV